MTDLVHTQFHGAGPIRRDADELHDDPRNMGVRLQSDCYTLPTYHIPTFELQSLFHIPLPMGVDFCK